MFRNYLEAHFLKFVPGRINGKIPIILDETNFSVGLVDRAIKALSSDNLQSGFRNTGIFSFNSAVVPRDMLLPCEIFHNDDLIANDSKATVKLCNENEKKKPKKACNLAVEISEDSEENKVRDDDTGLHHRKFGLFGVTAEIPDNLLLNYAGVVLAAVSAVIFSSINTDFNAFENTDTTSNNEKEQEKKIEVIIEDSFVDRLSPEKKRILGISLSVVSGVLYGQTFTPEIYVQGLEGHSDNALDYVFATYTGVYITSSVYFIIYCVLKQNKPDIYPNVIIPGLISGIMFGIATSCWFVANRSLSEPVAFPIMTTLPAVIAAFVGKFVFKEIEGKDRPKIEGYTEAVVPQYFLDDFKRFFRLTRSTFEIIVTNISQYPDLRPSWTGGREAIPIEKQLLVVLWYISGQETLNRIGDRDNGHLSRQQRHFNTCLSTTRVVVERSFAALKGRFRRLQYIDTQAVRTAVDMILVCCILHNICILNADEVDDFFDEVNDHHLIMCLRLFVAFTLPALFTFCCIHL
ncbi:hypothetical protein KUTeg_002465 [Tegillarca granosa]|uniref:DDE Tnp4 domain-containing protein n=1 Tax=Tegillarca granosa TaxID=220873 RepID=A0ABQ9FYW9_TEGGR|nr:hypothetical protein KUTeg_002465 [Tegillarca granosa]